MGITASRLFILEARLWLLKDHEGVNRQLSDNSLLRCCLRTALIAMAVVTVQALPVRAQEYVPCPPEQQSLLKIPELASQNGILRGTMMLSDEKEAIPFRQPPQSKPGDPGTSIRCQPQYVRILRGLNASPAPPPAAGAVPNPMPGPTLRARVGDIIQLTLINQIYPNHFGLSIDNGETGIGCDQPVPPGDKFPDCFHGSSTGNIHFHGTHTNPNTTGDNVFIEVRPLPRDNQGNLTTSPEKVQKSLDTFFADCATHLKGSALTQWPRLWSDMPSDWTDQQKSLLQAYDKQLALRYGVPPAKQLWPVNAMQLAAGGWPQYYVGAFPYCFRLPEFTPQPAKQTSTAMPGMPMGTSGEGNLGTSAIMGQAPGTHWYHAHKHGSTAIDVANGMTGAFIIEGQYDDDLNYFYGAGWTQTQPVLVINQIGVKPNLLRGGQGGQGGQGATDKGPDFSVNGQTKPVINMQPGEVQLWRIVNTSGRAGTYFLRPLPGTGYEWRQLAQDGVQFNDVNYQNHQNKNFLLAPGNRADLLVKALPCPNKAPTCTYPVLVQNEVDPSDRATANKLPLLSIQVSGSAIEPTSPRAKFIPQAPQFPAFLGDIKGTDVTGGKVIRFASTPPIAQHTINGVGFDGKVGALVQLNKVEEWKIVNETYGPAIAHPFHIHINPFQVVEVFDPNSTITITVPISKGSSKTKTVSVPQYIFDPKAQVSKKQCLLDPLGNREDWKPCGPTPENKNGIWWDVFPIPSGANASDAAGKPIIDPTTKNQVQVPGYFKMRSRFVDYAGYYVIHCHILAHEDRGMMTVVEVSPAPMPYLHN